MPNNDITQYPYLLLKVDEIGSNIYGTNTQMNSCFGFLISPEIIGDNAHYSYDESYETIIESGKTSQMTKIFSPRMDLSRLTFHILKPDGELYEFTDGSIIVAISITCLRKEIEENTIIRPN